jgi:hypothetical protein
MRDPADLPVSQAQPDPDAARARQKALIAHLDTLIARARAESAVSAAMQEAALEALARLDAARVDLTLDRFLATAERVLAVWARQRP